MTTRAHAVLTITNQSLPLPHSHPKIVWQKRRWVHNQERVSVDDDLRTNQPRDYWLCVQKVVVVIVVIRWCAWLLWERKKIASIATGVEKVRREEIFANVCNIWTILMYNVFWYHTWPIKSFWKYRFDLDENGKLDVTEFAAMIQRHRYILLSLNWITLLFLKQNCLFQFLKEKKS